jgi:hypothetical protein
MAQVLELQPSKLKALSLIPSTTKKKKKKERKEKKILSQEMTKVNSHSPTLHICACWGSLNCGGWEAPGMLKVPKSIVGYFPASA